MIVEERLHDRVYFKERLWDGVQFRRDWLPDEVQFRRLRLADGVIFRKRLRVGVEVV